MVNRFFCDLFAYGRGSLAWVRVYRSDQGELLALALDPLDSPGPSVVNDAAGLRQAIESAFGPVSRLRLFTHFPEREDKWTEVTWENEEGPEFHPCPREKLEALVGDSLEDPPDCSCAGLGGEGHPLLALVPPEEPPRNRLDEMGVVAIADLPWAHNPSECSRSERFEQLSSHYPSEHWNPAVGAHWFLTLEETDFAACPYHQGDWKRVADVSVEVLKAMPPGSQLSDAFAAVEEALPAGRERDWCLSLFRDPIAWEPGQEMVSNGQHRSCALRAGGASFCVADIGGNRIYDPQAGDPRRRAAATLGSYWSTRAGS